MWATGYLYHLVGLRILNQHPPFQVVASLVYDKMEISTEDPNMPWLSLVLQMFFKNRNTLWMRWVQGLGSMPFFRWFHSDSLPRGVVLKWRKKSTTVGIFVTAKPPGLVRLTLHPPHLGWWCVALLVFRWCRTSERCETHQEQRWRTSESVAFHVFPIWYHTYF